MQVPSLGQEDPPEKEMATHPVFLPGKSHGWRGLVGYSPVGHKELNMTERGKKRRVNIVFDWAGCGSYLRKERLKESYCISQLVAVNWGMWKFVQISM